MNRNFWDILTAATLLFLLTGCAPTLGRLAVKTPNHARDISQLEAGHEAEPAMRGAVIDHRFRVTVGEPAANLSVWVIHPSNEHIHDTEDGLWFDIPGNKQRKTRRPEATVLILHGYRHYKNDWAYLMGARFLAQHGYRTVLVDLRGHGASTGQWSTFGPGEAADLSHVIDELQRKKLLVGKLGVFGGSYGRATAIHLAGRDPRVRAVVTVSAFATMRDAVPSFIQGEAGWFAGLIGIWGWNNIVDAAGRAGGFDPDLADARRAIRRSHAYVLVTHSTAERHVLPAQAQALAEAGGDRVKLVLIDGPGHFKFGVNDAGRVRSAALAWFNRHLK